MTPEAVIITHSDHAGASLKSHMCPGGDVARARKSGLVRRGAGLGSLPPAMGYELWLMGPAGDRPAGMLPRWHAGMAGPMVVSGLAAGDRVGVTVEPVAGSARPTSRPLLMLNVGG